MRPPASTGPLTWYIVGSRCLAARSTTRLRSTLGLGNTMSAPARSLAIAEKALSRSLGPRVSRSCSRTPNARAASSVSFNMSLVVRSAYAPGFQRAATRETLGRASLSRPRRLATSTYPLRSSMPRCCGSRGVRAADQAPIGHRGYRDGLLDQAMEEQAPVPRGATVEAKGELVKVVGQVRSLGPALVGPEQPALQEGGHAVDAWQ